MRFPGKAKSAGLSIPLGLTDRRPMQALKILAPFLNGVLRGFEPRQLLKKLHLHLPFDW